jgi:hypothetical protein
VVIYSFVGSIVNLCNCCYSIHPLNVYVLMCTLCLVEVSRATPCVLWRDRYDTQGAGFGALQVVLEPVFVDTHGSSLPVG